MRINILLLLILFNLPLAAQQRPSIDVDKISGLVTINSCDQFLLYELAKKNISLNDWQQMLSVFVLDGDTNMPVHDLPVLGKYAVTDKHIQFTPRFPFDAGLQYLVKFNTPYFYALFGQTITDPGLRDVVRFQFGVRKEKVKKFTSLLQVYPSNDTIPVNQLKLYLTFSQSIRVGEVYHHIYLLDQSGNRVEAPFLQLQPELWDGTNKRLTLWLDPGRIKRGLNPNRIKGLPLQSNKHYQLIVDKNIRDIYGNQLAENYKKEYYVTKADRKKPAPGNWTMALPASFSRHAMELRFCESMDGALLNSMIEVKDNKGFPVAGKIEIDQEEKIWRFSPQNQWQKTTYFIHINSKLEDLAGNSIRRLFDTNTMAHNATIEDPKTLVIPAKFQKKATQKKVRKFNFRTSHQ